MEKYFIELERFLYFGIIALAAGILMFEIFRQMLVKGTKFKWKRVEARLILLVIFLILVALCWILQWNYYLSNFVLSMILLTPPFVMTFLFKKIEREDNKRERKKEGYHVESLIVFEGRYYLKDNNNYKQEIDKNFNKIVFPKSKKIKKRNPEYSELLTPRKDPKIIRR